MDTSPSLNRRLPRFRFHTATIALVAGALALPSTAVLAAEPPAESPTEASATAKPDPAVARSQALFEQGLDAYEADDYSGAAHYWTEAHDLMPQTAKLAAGRRVLGFDLAQAQMRAYAKDHHQSRVTAAKPLLEGFVAWVDRPGHTMDEGEQQDRARALELLEQIEDESPPPSSPPAPELVQPAPVPAQDLPPTATEPDGTGLLIGGGVALGAGVASLAVMFAMQTKGSAAEARYDDALQRLSDGGASEAERAAADADREAAERDGRRSNIGLLTAASGAVLLTAAGVTMLAIGGHRRRRHVSASAALGPSSAGVTMSFRF